MDHDFFLRLIGQLFATFRVEPDEASLEGYWLGLSDLTGGELQTACMRAVRECEFLPKPVELRRLSGQMTTDSRCVIAWAAVSQALRRYGTYRSLDFDDPLVNAAIRNMGGTRRLGELDSQQFEVWARKEFERIYTALCETGVGPEAAAPLLGEHAAKNAGFEHDPRAVANGPTKVVTGLPPHRRQVVKQLAEVATVAGALAGSMQMPTALVVDPDAVPANGERFDDDDLPEETGNVAEFE